MPKQPKRRLGSRFSTPPPELVPEERPSQVETPQRSALIAVIYFCQKESIPCNLKDLNEVFNVPKSTANDIISKRCRKIQHSDLVSNPRGGLRQLTNSDANAVESYIKEAPFQEKADPWQDLAERAGVVKVWEPKGKENVQFSGQVIQRRVTQVTTIKTHKAVVKEKHTPSQVQARIEYAELQLQLRPTKYEWRLVLWCDEIHFTTGAPYQKDVKREAGDPARYHPDNIQYDKDHKPDPENVEKVHLYCVLGYNLAWCMPYNSDNSNGKMNTTIYINVILPALKSYMLSRGGDWTLWQDRDSAHISKATLDWMDHNSIPYINSSLKSPDISIIETWTSPLSRKFHERRMASTKLGIERFYKVWQKLDLEKINNTIDHYPARLKALKDSCKGKATKY